MQLEQICLNCKFWKEHQSVVPGEMIGKCRYNPPASQNGMGKRYDWPLTSSIDMCSKFELSDEKVVASHVKKQD